MKDAFFSQQHGPWALITGASDGIGKEFVRQLAARGLNVALVAERPELLQQIASECEAAHGVATRIIPADLCAPAGRAQVIDCTSDVDIGILVAAAGFGTSGPILKADLVREREMLDVNCYALLEQCVTFAQRFARRGRGGIILISSLVGWQGVPRAAHYAATKAYIQSLAEALHVELKPKGISVLAAAPGPVHSGFGRRADMRMNRTDPASEVANATRKALGRHSRSATSEWPLRRMGCPNSGLGQK